MAGANFSDVTDAALTTDSVTVSDDAAYTALPEYATSSGYEPGTRALALMVSTALPPDNVAWPTWTP